MITRATSSFSSLWISWRHATTTQPYYSKYPRCPVVLTLDVPFHLHSHLPEWTSELRSIWFSLPLSVEEPVSSIVITETKPDSTVFFRSSALVSPHQSRFFQTRLRVNNSPRIMISHFADVISWIEMIGGSDHVSRLLTALHCSGRDCCWLIFASRP